MSTIVLYVAPGSCARVPTIALEEIGVPFETRLVRFMKGEHKALDYKRFNPKGKVPALVIDGEALTENVAIILYLNQRFPDAGLLPPATGALEEARQIADLCFCSSTLHPLVTRIRMPQMFAASEAVRSVWEIGCAAMREYFKLIDDRLATQPWWWGETWSAMDAYLFWVFWRVEGAKFPVADFPNFVAHAARIQQRPSVQRALARETKDVRQLESEGLAFTPPPLPV
jgi:glutathione S-transferase